MVAKVAKSICIDNRSSVYPNKALCFIIQHNYLSNKCIYLSPYFMGLIEVYKS